MNRRAFLKTGLLGGALLALGGASLALFPSRKEGTPTRPLRVLGEGPFQVMVAVARRMVTDPGADPVAIAQQVDVLAACLPIEARRDLVKLLGLFESALGGLLLDGNALPFTRLSPKEQDRVIERWRSSRITLRRSGYQALKKLSFLAHYMQPWSWSAIDFPTPPAVGEPYDDSKMGTPEWLRARELEAVP